mmetsp:Transcript_88757/g.249997  ORF Transcript_88757/g.249997 Transcript_88757/m.249997 type:complete len:253 (-) Transcript_88757:17-775(-)
MARASVLGATRKGQTEAADTIRVPTPTGIQGVMSMNSPAELRVVFDMLDERKRGLLDRIQARYWLRCAGWCVSQEKLDEMLNNSEVGRYAQRIIDTGFYSKGQVTDPDNPEMARWTFQDLCDILRSSSTRTNLGLDDLVSALSTLSNSKRMVPVRQLIRQLDEYHGISESDLKQVCEMSGFLTDVQHFDIRILSRALLDRVVSDTYPHLGPLQCRPKHQEARYEAEGHEDGGTKASKVVQAANKQPRRRYNR